MKPGMGDEMFEVTFHATCGANPHRFTCSCAAPTAQVIVLGWGRNPPRTLMEVRNALGHMPPLEAVERCESGHRRRLMRSLPDDSLVRWDDGLKAAVINVKHLYKTEL